MDIYTNKSNIIEYIENIYGLATNYLENKNNIELKNLLKELELIENKIRLCNDIDLLDNYKIFMDQLVNRIEDIINE